MNIIINGRHLDITPAIRSYAEDKVRKFERFLVKISEVAITLSVEKYRHKAEMFLRVNGVLIQAESVTEEIYASIDEVIEKIERQIRKIKDKMSSRRKDSRIAIAGSTVVAAQPEAAIRTLKTVKIDMKPMSPEEAAMQMDILDRDFFVFSNDRTGDINVIYKLRDGDFGLIEPAK